MKKPILCLILMALLAVNAAAEGRNSVLNTGTSAALFEGGEVLVPPGVYSELIPLGGSGLYAAKAVGSAKYMLADSNGKALTKALYDRLGEECGTIIFVRDGFYGAMDLNGDLLIEPQYTFLTALDGNDFLALKTHLLDDTPDALYAVSLTDGETNSSVRLAYAPFEASEGLCAAVAPNGRYGYLGAGGLWALEPGYLWAGAFVSGRAPVRTESGMGLIDRDGEWIIEPIEGRLVMNGSGEVVLAVYEAGGAALYEAGSGKKAMSFPDAADAWFSDDAICLALRAGGFRVIDGQGETIHETDTDVLMAETKDGLCIERRAFSEKEACTLIGRDGAIVGQWQELAFAGTENGEVYCLFASYETVKTEMGGFVFYDEVRGTRRYGLIDSAGNVVIGDLLQLKPAADGLLMAESEAWLGLIRPDGTIVARLDKAE